MSSPGHSSGARLFHGSSSSRRKGRETTLASTTARQDRIARLHFASDSRQSDPPILQRERRADRADVLLAAGDAAPVERFRLLPPQSTQLAVGVSAKVEPRDRFLPGIAPLRVRYPTDLVVPDFLWQRPVVDLHAECGPALDEPRDAQVAVVTGFGSRVDELRHQGLDRGRHSCQQPHEWRRLRRERNGHRAQVATDGHYARGRLRRSDPGPGQHLKRMPPQQPDYPRLTGEVGDLGEPRGELSLKELHHRLVPFARRDDGEAVGLTNHPRVHHDHALGRQECPVDEAVVPRLLEVVREHALQTSQGAGPTDTEDSGLVHYRGGAVPDAGKARVIEDEIGLRHGPTADRPGSGRRNRAR